MLKELYNVVRAYQIVMVPESRNTYFKQIRLRSFASQYMNLAAAVKDGFIYPFLLFSVQENNLGGPEEIGDSRMIELNFIDDTINVRQKDHTCRSYHISMVQKIIKGFKYDEFIIEFQNDTKPVSYFATFPLQRDFIVEMINFAVYKYKKSLIKIKGINCPDNHNLKKKKHQETQIPDIDKHVTSDLKIEFITDDIVLPPKAIKIGECMKKNRSMGYEQRYLMLGHS